MAGLSLELFFSPWTFGLLGLLIGSFLNVVIHRMPAMLERAWVGDMGQLLQDDAAMRRVLGPAPALMPVLRSAGASLTTAIDALTPLSLSQPRSRCPACARPIAWHENMPIVSWLRLRGRCAGCGTRISVRYPLIEALTSALFFAAAWRFPVTSTAIVYCAALALLVAMAFIDLDTTLLPDDLTLPLLGLGLGAAWLRWTPVAIESAALGALFGYLSLWAVGGAYRLVRRVEGMAEGDFKMLAGLGALLGWQVLPSVVLLASAVGALVGIGMILFRGHDKRVPIPFGPYLASGGVAALFFGPALTRLWFPTL